MDQYMHKWCIQHWSGYWFWFQQKCMFGWKKLHNYWFWNRNYGNM